MTRGTLNAVWFMITIVALVQVGFVALFVGFWRRSRALKKFREQFHVVEGGMQ